MRTIATRDRLIEVAERLVQEKGFHRTTLAALASKARVHLGSIYHFFRTKQALGEAIVDARLERHRRQLAEWSEIEDPRERIAAFVRSVAAARGDLARKGCPIGSLCQELHPGARAARGEVFGALPSAARLDRGPVPAARRGRPAGPRPRRPRPGLSPGREPSRAHVRRSGAGREGGRGDRALPLLRGRPGSIGQESGKNGQ